MNTLSRAITARFFTDENGYQGLRRRWSGLMASESKRHRLTAAHHMLYLVLCGKDWRRAFTPISNPRKLANGAYFGWALLSAVRLLNSRRHEEELLAPFEGIVAPDTLRVVRSYLQHVNLNVLGPRAFEGGSFPFDAYSMVSDSAAIEGNDSRGCR